MKNNIVYLVKYIWSVKILQNLLQCQEDHPWKVKLVIIPKTEINIPDFKEVNSIRVNPEEIGKYAHMIGELHPIAIPSYGWNWILPKSITSIAPCLVLHPSKLPKYRGGTPINNQLLDGVTESAITIIEASDKLDGGDIYAQVDISFQGYLHEIWDRMAEEGLRASLKLFDDFAEGTVAKIKQNDANATFVRRRKQEQSEITLHEIQSQPAEYLYNKIRGLQKPYPEAFIVCGDGKKLFITRAYIEGS